MGKFRSKLKGQSKGKRWQKGHSSDSNPKTNKYRELAKSRFFQENLGNTGLTQDAVYKHNAITTYGHKVDKTKSGAVSELAIVKDFESMSVRTEDDNTSESQYTASGLGTFKTFQTFASDWSQCSNVSFNKLLTKFDSNNAVHKEMLAILAAVTEVIKEQGGTQSTTEYFAALMETLKGSETEEGLAATLSLLAMGIKSVPQPVLRRQFSDAASVFMGLLEKYADSENGTILRCAIGCLSVVLRAQEHALWGDSSTGRVFDGMLAFALHAKPKVRKAGQHAVTAVLRGSCFMIPTDDDTVKVPKLHPAAGRVAEFCLRQLTAEALLSGHRTVLHTLTLLRDVMPAFSRDHVKSCCESILSLMTHNSVYMKTCCLHALHALLSAPSSQLAGGHALQLARALLAARPPAGDAALALAWATVVQQAYACLARLDLNHCLPNVITFVKICVSELWLSDILDINSAATNALKVVLYDCIKPAIDKEDALLAHRQHVEAVFDAIASGLDNPFNQAIKHVILTIAVCFEIGNENTAAMLAPILIKLNERSETVNFHNRKEMEHATGCAVRSLGPAFVLECIPLKDGPDSINLDRSWLLPVLKEKISNSELRFFATEILEMATLCRRKTREFAEKKDMAKSHTYDLLCTQFWSLLPSFCNNPKDVKDSFRAVAKVLGNILKDNSEFRLSVMQGLRKLINVSVENNREDDVKELGKFAKNFVPILLNVYMTPVKGSNAEGQRLAALETIQVYLTVADQKLREEFFTNALQQLESSKDNHFQRESILDIIRLLVLYQDSERIAELFDKWVFPLCETVLDDPRKFKRNKKVTRNLMEKEEPEAEKKKELRYRERAKMLEMEHKKAYRILEEIFKSEKESCKQFLKSNQKKIKKLLMSTLNKAADSSKAARLRCIEHLIVSTPHLSPDCKMVKGALAEAVVCTRDINSKCRQCAFSLITTVGNSLKAHEEGMQSYVKMLLSGLEANVPRVTSATVRAVSSALFNFAEPMGLETVQGLLERVCELMLGPGREVVTACLGFLKVYAKVLPTEVLAGSLPLIFKSLSSMADDCKRHSRLEIGYFLTKMIRKYGASTVETLIPPHDEVMLRRLRNLRKMENRKKRIQDSQEMQNDSDSDLGVKGSSKTLEEILADSDSELEHLDEPAQRKKAKGKKSEAWIQDDPDNIVDLADVGAARKITGTDPKQKTKIAERKTQKKKDGGFKMAADGRLIITDDASDSDDEEAEPKPSGDIDPDTSDTDDEKPSTSKLVKVGAKRKYDDIVSIKSSSTRITQPANKYRAGGKGIHRPLNSAASVASSVGTEYRSKKAKGDVKKKGQHDPYAYLPLSRKSLNRRKRAQHAKQFKGIVKNKTKIGGLKGRKRV